MQFHGIFVYKYYLIYNRMVSNPVKEKLCSPVWNVTTKKKLKLPNWQDLWAKCPPIITEKCPWWVPSLVWPKISWAPITLICSNLLDNLEPVWLEAKIRLLLVTSLLKWVLWLGMIHFHEFLILKRNVNFTEKFHFLYRLIFNANDEPLLNYLNEDNQRIEPYWYLPIIPMVLVNGAEGIGTGWSSKVPNYDPREIINVSEFDLTRFKNSYLQIS